ncbi:unnamed protein product [Lepeophtheirus salmonis]|uniref:(salmon louse) hypothetical protein n=1 Tax=Lepeophtheirus salmonis TaxID=72036 RepID=A0A7R8CJU1_LEPSM|nr:unnamed protein product [Lepeophtheirus salmonis]CAF2839435.1 unnamed protein product [Lepeophtheirus salmonis]
MFANMVFDDDLGKFNSRAEGDSGISTAEGSFNSSNGEVIHLYSIGTNTDLDNQVEKMDIDCGYVSYRSFGGLDTFQEYSTSRPHP